MADELVSSESAPKKISKVDPVSARRVITFCALSDDYQGGVQVENLDDVLPTIEDYGKACDKLTDLISLQTLVKR